MRLGLLLFWSITLAGFPSVAADWQLSFAVRTTASSDSFPMIAGNKAWETGGVIDVTTHHNLGLTRSSGALAGWAISLQPNGSWAWNIGSGQRRLDYLPTAVRQPINDGKWHELQVTFIENQRAVYLLHDQRVVAIYSLDDLQADKLSPLFDEKATFTEGTFQFKRIQQTNTPILPSIPPKETVAGFRLLCWNIWHGGRRDGNVKGLKRTIQLIRESQADVICMQETYGSGPIIADSLGYVFYYRSSNLSIHSRFPILETTPFGDPFRIGGAVLELGPGQRLRVFSLWINYAPNIDRTIPEAVSADSLIAQETHTRLAEIRAILDGMRPLGEELPAIVAGDFNSPSHLDWTESTRSWHRQLVAVWPVSKSMIDEGFTDAFRHVHPEPSSYYGRTWSPRFKATACHERIDHVYYRGEVLNAQEADMLDNDAQNWPSDHAAVLVTFQWK